jgi:hypothetical protein
MSFSGCWRRACLCVAAALLLGSWGFAQDPGAPKDKEKPKEKVKTAADKAFDKQVNAAIDKGVSYLRSVPTGGSGTTALGETALAGLALLEAGVPPNDPAIRRIADAVRQGSIKESYGYCICVAIMLLDRLGDPHDEPFIEALAVRLLASQIRQGAGQEGGWAYYTEPPQPAEIKRLTDCLKDRKQPAGQAAAGAGNEKRKPRTSKDLPKEILDQIETIYREGKGPVDQPGGNNADNSNTQFALLALWAARRHGIPVERAFALAEQRLRKTQQANGGWGYMVPLPGVKIKEPAATPQMTCCGLIGLALAYGANATKGKMAEDKTVINGLKAIAAVIGNPYGDSKDVPRFEGKKADKLYYTLWSLERMAALFGFTDIQGKDWYKWGAQILLANQNPDGSWTGAYSEGGCDTCFALLFLKRANIAADLTERIKKEPNLRPPLVEPIRDPAGKGGKRPPPGSSQAPRPGGPAAALLGRPGRPDRAREKYTRAVASGGAGFFDIPEKKNLTLACDQRTIIN